MNNVRREAIRSFVEKEQVVTMEQLKALFPDLSLMTLHRDLNFLQEQGFLIKLRGGARYNAAIDNEPAFSAREIVNRDAKTRIAEKALPFVQGSTSAFVDAGTTMMALAKVFPNIRCNVVTTGPNIALELSRLSMTAVNVTGGELNKSNLTLSGATALDNISQINIDTAFLVASGFSSECGFTCGMEMEARIKRIVCQKARRRVMLLDLSKIDRVLPYTFADLRDIDVLITEREPEDWPKLLKDALVSTTIERV